ncbi:MAG TPA: diacylglycerol kinase [Lachnospiraceae bacterium]|nr:diacylglycerol kinase [Lachnospiraceae bacterium]
MKLIAAADARWGIGKDGKLLVSIPADMKYFQSVTSGHTVIMGRKTLESFPGKKPLKNRRNIVLTTRKDLKMDGVEIASGVEEALRMVSGSDPDEVFCIGGAQIYRLFLPYCDTALITRIDHVYDADAFLPDLDQSPEWVKTGESDEQVFFHLTYHFCTYKRRSS